MRIRGLIFDLDGTLVDSRLDFNAMRQEMGLPDGAPVLETIQQLADHDAQRCWKILERHEAAGAEGATLIPGVAEFLTRSHRADFRQAVLTRNGRQFAERTLARLNLRFEQVMTRDDGPIKPDPAAIWEICENWNLAPAECVIIGDYRFDLEAGQAAGTRTVLYTEEGRLRDRPWAKLADFWLDSFTQVEELWAWLDNPAGPLA